MDFRLANTTAYWWPVKVSVPDPARSGEVLEQELEIRIKPQGQDEFLAEQERIATVPGLRARARAERDYLATRIEDWRGVVADDGTPVTLTPEALDIALQQLWFRNGIWRALVESEMGEAAKKGN